MSNLINPLQGLLGQASKLPASTGLTADYTSRLRVDGPSLILADASGSMSANAWGGQSKIKIVGDVVHGLVNQCTSVRLIAFSTDAREVTTLPSAGGSTALHAAFEYAKNLRPRSTLVISDGQPDDSEAALRAAERITGRIDALYVGPDSDIGAIAFMNKLARSFCGSFHRADLNEAQPLLASRIESLLLGYDDASPGK
jgi:Mg-chelatase subunit ChlD